MKTIKEQVQEINRWASKTYGEDWISNLAVKTTVRNAYKEIIYTGQIGKKYDYETEMENWIDLDQVDQNYEEVE